MSADANNERSPTNDAHQSTEKNQHEGLKEKLKSKKAKIDEKSPSGGVDKTPVARREPGYTVKITFHRATNLPMADYGSLSSDPYVLATLTTDLPPRHKEDPALQLRTRTIRRNTDPEWNTEWIVANVPSSGFKCKARLYDEDPTDHDDRLGNAHINVSGITESWEGIRNQAFKIKKRAGSKRAYFIRLAATCFNKAKHTDGSLFVSVEVLGRTETDNGGRCYTAGPIWYTRHYSPLLGRITGKTEPGEKKDGEDDPKQAAKYNFQANQYQLHGPVPEALYHRYVEFKPWVKLMFTTSGIRGWLLSKALHHQHARVYNFDRTTEHHVIGEEPSKKATEEFLNLTHHDEGGRIFTYVLTLDSLFRFTETGKEFGVDMLSKHTMHSDVNIYIAFSGEFFIRRLPKKRDPPPPDAPKDDENQHPPTDLEGGAPNENSPKDPEYYELVIDNDSGTYRPSADLLPQLKKFLAYNFPGLHILTLDCNKDADRQQRMKKEQREKKEKEGNHAVYTQGSRSSSISSSDVSDLDERERRADQRTAGGDEQAEPGFLKTVKHDISARGNGLENHLEGLVKGRGE